MVRGEIAGPKWVRLSCQRQLDDLKRFKGKDSPYRFNPTLTDKTGRKFRPADDGADIIQVENDLLHKLRHLY